MKGHVTIIAEAGVNHNGDIEIAKKLIDAAAEAGADYVKFQTYKTDKLVSLDAKKAEYQKMDDGEDSQYKMLKHLELSKSDHIILQDYASAKNIGFLSTAFDLDSLDFLDQLGIDFIKIPSGEITNYPYLVKVARKNKPIILSTGMSNMQEILEALEVLQNNGIVKKNITILHCNSAYPTPFEDVNLRAMLTIADSFEIAYGYSDHTMGIEVPIAAVALGATVIEKHFTLNRNLPGPDHKASLEPGELKHMVAAIRNIENAIEGHGRKESPWSEERNKDAVRKSIYVKTAIKKDERLTEDKLIPLRPGDGISPMEWPKVIGKKVCRDMQAFEKLKWKDLK